MSQVTWVLESEVFANSHEALRAALGSASVPIVDWNDEWWSSGNWPALDGVPVVFHGSLGNAAAIAEKMPWIPGSFCRTTAFHCSAWYEAARRWLVHTDWRILPAEELVANSWAICREMECRDSVFVRPDSPLKPFSGRVVPVNAITLNALDHGFYYDDPRLPVVVAPIRRISFEWRFVVVKRRIIAGSAYDATTRSARSDDSNSKPWEFAAYIASELSEPEEVYLLDVCESDGDLRLLELNPFSGGDLYACSATSIVPAVSEVAREIFARRN